MATTTSPATGTRLGTGMRPPAPPQKESPFAVILKQFSALPSRVKFLVSVVGALIVIGIVVGMLLKSSSTPVGIFDGRRLDQYDVADVTKVLDELKIQGYIIQDNGEQGQKILVPPDKKYYVQIELSKRGLPRRKFNAFLPPNPTQHQLDEHKIRELRSDITMTLREIDGVVDALVSLVIPPKSAFLDAKEDAKAAIVLKLRPGFALQGETLMAISNLVANSVPGLKPENVQIVDTNGRNYYTAGFLDKNKSMSSMSGGGIPLSSDEQQTEKERKIKESAQSMLDTFLGSGRSVVRVSAQLNFDEVEIESKKVGGPTNLSGETISSQSEEKEIYAGGSKKTSGFQQVSNKAGKNGNSYEKTKKIINKKTTEVHEIKKLHIGDIRHLSVAVAVDNLKPDMVANVQKLVKNAVGFQASRGDQIAVASFPFSNKEMQVMADRLLNGNGDSMRSPFSGLSPAIMTKMVAIPIILAVIVLAIFVLRSQKMEAEKNRLVLATVPTTTVNDISDLLNDKAGHSAPSPQTSRNNNSVEQLERMAKEKPSKVADLLKTTFLVER